MKRKYIKLFLITLLMVFCIATPCYAAGKVTKVTSKTFYPGNYKQYTIIYGKNNSGKIIWRYKSNKYTATELDAVSYTVQKDNVYILENNKFIRLNKQTGKCIVRKNVKTSIWGATMKIDSKGSLYAQGYYGDTVYKFNKSGKILWKRKIKNCYWPYKMSLSNNKLTVYYDGENKYYKAMLSASNGKVIKYYKHK